MYFRKYNYNLLLKEKSYIMKPGGKVLIVDLTLFNLGKEKIVINEDVYFSKEDLKNTEIIDLENIKINGEITLNSLNQPILYLKIKGKMILPCSRTLKPTAYEFETEIEENIEENPEKYKKTTKTIDILPIIWENILMEIPIKVINPDAEDIKEKGNGWELITDDD